MSTAALRYCAQPGCPQKTAGTRCPQHQRIVRQHQQRFVSTTPGVNYGRRWKAARFAYLAEHPWCAECLPARCIIATQLDHIVPHRGDYALFWDEANWQGLCRTHHDAKTAREVRLGHTRGGL